jgi:hypothetical protein
MMVWLVVWSSSIHNPIPKTAILEMQIGVSLFHFTSQNDDDFFSNVHPIVID